MDAAADEGGTVAAAADTKNAEVGAPDDVAWNASEEEHKQDAAVAADDSAAVVEVIDSWEVVEEDRSVVVAVGHTMMDPTGCHQLQRQQRQLLPNDNAAAVDDYGLLMSFVVHQRNSLVLRLLDMVVAVVVHLLVPKLDNRGVHILLHRAVAVVVVEDMESCCHHHNLDDHHHCCCDVDNGGHSWVWLFATRRLLPFFLSICWTKINQKLLCCHTC